MSKQENNDNFGYTEKYVGNKKTIKLYLLILYIFFIFLIILFYDEHWGETYCMYFLSTNAGLDISQFVKKEQVVIVVLYYDIL